MKHQHKYDKDGKQLCCTLEEKIHHKTDKKIGCCQTDNEHKHSDDDGHDHSGDDRTTFQMFLPAVISFIFLLVAIGLDNYFTATWFTGYVSLSWYLIAYLLVGYPVLKEAFESIRKGEIFSEFLLMGIATIGAFAIGEYPEGVAVMLFYAIGEIFQTLAVQRAKTNIKLLLDQRPDEATVMNGENATVKKASEIITTSNVNNLNTLLKSIDKNNFDEKKLYAIQLDNQSRFLKRWSDLVLANAIAKPNDKANAIAKELKNWNGRADIDQPGHRIARAFRQQVLDQLWKSWLAAAQRAKPIETHTGKQDLPDGRFEYAAWAALEARAAHLLPPPFASWDDFLAAQLANVYDDLIRQNVALSEATWGKRNTTNIRHPFTHAMPFLSNWLNMPNTPLAGDNHKPRVAAPAFGASQRMVVSPGHEEQGIFVMPGGQSGHPLSPFYGAGHNDWLTGKPGSLLAGEATHSLRFVPWPGKL